MLTAPNLTHRGLGTMAGAAGQGPDRLGVGVVVTCATRIGTPGAPHCIPGRSFSSRNHTWLYHHLNRHGDSRHRCYHSLDMSLLFAAWRCIELLLASRDFIVPRGDRYFLVRTTCTLCACISSDLYIVCSRGLKGFERSLILAFFSHPIRDLCSRVFTSIPYG